jgi:DNA-binding MarR family transcriptional regulator
VPAGEPLSEEETDAWLGLLRTRDRVVASLDRALTSAHGLKVNAFEVLVVLERSPGGRLSMSALADSAYLSQSGMTRIVDGLERRGLVTRRRDPGDGRRLEAVLTDAGRALHAAARTTHRAALREAFFDRLSAAQVRQLGGAWRRVGGARDGR